MCLEDNVTLKGNEANLGRLPFLLILVRGKLEVWVPDPVTTVQMILYLHGPALQ